MTNQESDPESGRHSTATDERGSGKDSGSHSEKTNEASDTLMVPKNKRNSPELEMSLKDRYIVDWEGPDDPACPRNWSWQFKWANLSIVALLALLT